MWLHHTVGMTPTSIWHSMIFSIQFEPGSKLSRSDHRNKLVPNAFVTCLARTRSISHSSKTYHLCTKAKSSFQLEDASLYSPGLTFVINDSLIWSGERYFWPASMKQSFLLANFSSGQDLAGVVVGAVGIRISCDRASSRIKRSRSDTRNPRSGSVGWLDRRLGQEPLIFNCWPWGHCGKVDSPSLGWGVGSWRLSVTPTYSATTWATSKILWAPRSYCIPVNRITWLIPSDLKLSCKLLS